MTTQNDGNSTKPWYQSSTILASIATGIIAILGIFHFQFITDAEVNTLITAGAAILGVILTVLGRVKASKGIHLLLVMGTLSFLLVGCADTPTTGSSTTAPAGTATASWTQFGVTSAGVGASIAIIELVNKDDKAGTASDILTVDAALLTLLDGTIPTEAQITSVMESFKSDKATTKYGLVAQKIASQFSSQLTAWKSSGATAEQITQYATWFISGTQLGAAIYAE